MDRVLLARRSRRPRRDVVQTRHLVAAMGEARPHLVYVSIVGADRVPVGLLRAKLESERLIEASGAPWTVLRATEFHAPLMEPTALLARQ